MEHLVRDNLVDVLLIAGDLFDHARVPDDLVTATFERLALLDAEVLLLPGNHDAHDETAVYRRHRNTIDAAGVKFFDTDGGDVIDVADNALRVWSKSMTEHTPEFSPLYGVPDHPGDRWFVVAGHGHFAPAGTEDHRSSRITVEHINATRADYVALGHWHVTTDLSTRGATTPAWYCGAPLFGHGAGNLLLVDFIPGEPVNVAPVHVLDHPAASCASGE